MYTPTAEDIATASPDGWAARWDWSLGDCVETYEQSVLWTAWQTTDERLELHPADLGRLLDHHGASLAELTAEAATTGLPVCHAGQALLFLGY
jgi:hypothetical protein